MVEVGGILVTSKQTEKAIYAAQIVRSFDGQLIGAGADAQWLPKSLLHGVVLGETFDNVRNDGTIETRREFTASVPEWLARKLFPVRRGPIPMATKPW